MIETWLEQCYRDKAKEKRLHHCGKSFSGWKALLVDGRDTRSWEEEWTGAKWKHNCFGIVTDKQPFPFRSVFGTSPSIWKIPWRRHLVKVAAGARRHYQPEGLLRKKHGMGGKSWFAASMQDCMTDDRPVDAIYQIGARNGWCFWCSWVRIPYRCGEVSRRGLTKEDYLLRDIERERKRTCWCLHSWVKLFICIRLGEKPILKWIFSVIVVKGMSRWS